MMPTAITTRQGPRRTRSYGALAPLALAIIAPCLGLASGCAAPRSCILRGPNADLQARAHSLLADGQATSDAAGAPTVTP